MKAIVQRGYGPPRKVYSLEEVDRPVLKQGEVLVEVRAASVHADVWHMALGRPLMLRFMGGGFFRPRVKIPGTDMAGVVAELGDGVDRWSIGDRVFGETLTGHQWKNGASFAEYVAVEGDSVRAIPEGVGFEAAATVPTSGLIARRTMVEDARVQPGNDVLINGAGGAVGTVALQIAKAHGARVTAVDRGEKLSMLESLGADRVIDFTATDFTATGDSYDVVYDIPGNRTFEELQPIVKAGGRYVLIGHDDFGAKGSKLIGSAVGKYIRMGIRRPFGTPVEIEITEAEDPLGDLAGLMANGKLTPAIGGTYSLGAAVDAMEALASGSVAGKIVLTP